MYISEDKDRDLSVTQSKSRKPRQGILSRFPHPVVIGAGNRMDERGRQGDGAEE